MQIFIFVCLLILSVQAFATSDITWSYSRISFQGPKEPVLKVTNQLSEIYKRTDVGEKVIHALMEKRPKFHVHQDNGQYVYAKDEHNHRHLVGEGTDTANLYQIMIKVLKEEYGAIPRNVSLDNFIKELRGYELTEVTLDTFPFVKIKSDKKKLNKMINTIMEIQSYPLGKKLFEDMAFCQKELLIYDDKHSVGGGGYTGALQPGERIFNGEGSDAYIRFRFDQPDKGSHIVGTVDSKTIPFTYIDNIYHELVHAKHLMCGTMAEFTSEAQAIAEENEFRSVREETKNWPARDPRQYEEGKQIWFGKFID
ncbi:MAG: type III secretion system effector protein [Halobacteriovoraceae bacterium]|nr:type III secretion system effector protein [Halobacteriovoraceae bacterium]